MNSDQNTVNSNTVLNRHLLMYSLVLAFVAGLTAFDGALATGAVPIPHSWAWVTPILAIMAVSLTTTLPKVVDGLPPATSAASIESVAKYQQPTITTPSLTATAVGTLVPSFTTAVATPITALAPQEHIVRLVVAQATATPEARIIDVAASPPTSPPEPAAPAATPA